jgi:hypothetical protein
MFLCLLVSSCATTSINFINRNLTALYQLRRLVIVEGDQLLVKCIWGGSEWALSASRRWSVSLGSVSTRVLAAVSMNMTALWDIAPV